ncbi:precorrin-3B synthase [Actinacidiphila reveromycinica]|nr:precorrin-3B synthase [Streptomyces sp. SN-593]
MSTAPDLPVRPPRPDADACSTGGGAQPAGTGAPVPDGAGLLRDRGDACPGALRLHPADDGALARVRIPGGVLDAAQAERLGEAARRFGDGDVHLTSRGNVQLRGLDAGCGAELAQLLGAAGLLPSATHERVRNVVASPLSGLDGRGHLDVGDWLRELDGLLCGSPAAAALSGRFLFALDDGRGDVAALAPDVTLRAAPDGTALLAVGRNAALRVTAADAPRAALLAAELFLAEAASEGGEPSAWRVADLPDRGAALTAELAGRLPAPPAPGPEPAPAADPAPAPVAVAARGKAASPAAPDGTRSGAVPAAPDGTRAKSAPTTTDGTRAKSAPTTTDHGTGEKAGPTPTADHGTRAEPAPTATDHGTEERSAPTAPPSAASADAFPALGPVAHPAAPGGPLALSVLAPLGRLTADQWRALCALAARTPAAHLRLTPWRGAVVPGVPADRAREELAALAAAGLVTDAASPWVGVSACAGRPGCAKSLADVRADAAALVRSAPGDAEPSRPAPGSAEPGGGGAPADGAPRPGGPAAPRLLPVHWSGCPRRCGRPRTADRVEVVATPDGYRVDLFHRAAATPGTPSRSVHPGPPDLAATVAAARRGAPTE